MRHLQYANSVILLILLAFFVNEKFNASSISQQLPTSSPVVETQKDRLSFDLLQLAAKTKDQQIAKILNRLSEATKICGPLCQQINSAAATERFKIGQNQYFNELQVPIDCKAILSTSLIDVSDSSVVYPIPEELKPYYSMNGAVKLINWQHLENIYSGKKAFVPVWDVPMVEDFEKQSENGTLKGNYGQSNCAAIRATLEGSVEGRSVLVIGSEFPWVESICTSLGAKSVTTLEYGAIESTHPKISTMTPPEMRQAYVEGRLPEFDIVVSYSSLEHSGLGRYGDALNPWGDVLAVARAWCVTKKGGKMLLGLPVGVDQIEFNAHRIYGKHRLSVLTANWKLINTNQLEERGDTHRFFDGNSAMYQPSMMFEKVM